jgi:hypothetical protein
MKPELPVRVKTPFNRPATALDRANLGGQPARR